MTEPTTDSGTWATRQEAAEELSRITGEPVSVNKMMGWLRQPNCPLPKGRGPIPKRELIDWVEAHRPVGRSRTSPQGGDYAQLELEKLREEVRRLKGQNERIWNESVNAEDARTGVVRAMEELRRELTSELPSAAWEASQGTPVEEAVAAIRALLTAALNRFHESAAKLGQ